jgi:hypothetical protein
MKNVKAVFANSKYLQLSMLGSKYNLSFSSHLAVGNKIIALDGSKRSLLIWDTGKEPDAAHIVELDKVTAVTIKKKYGSIASGELKYKSVEQFLQTIELQFEYANNEPIALPFYNRITDSASDLKMLERNAKNWQMILSRMAGQQTIPHRQEVTA